MQTIADYELVKSLGYGSHGQFFLARKPARLPVDVELVAVKVFAGTSTADIFRRATRELKAFAAVRSPHIVTLYDAGRHDGVIYYSMEYLPGGSLANPAGPVMAPQAVRAVRDAALGVSALHAVGLAHRDIKPGNILLGDGIAKLSDLGLAHVMMPGVSLTGMGPVASIEYTDPELLQGAPASEATDLWSLGVTLHRVLSGRGVYGADLPTDDGLLALRKALMADPQISADLPPAAATLVRACLGPAEDRPSAEEFARQLDAIPMMASPS
ncbi:MAG TPA: serine/threonine-protein kinase [Trebonia sp.]|nr:serine/threonine-protein kinase [Trebonia sp.]